MTNVLYPESWEQLSDSPSARWELIISVLDVASWNSDDAAVRSKGADNIIGFLLDDYRMNEGVRGLVGKLIFADEAESLKKFVSEFDHFITNEKLKFSDLSRIHEVRAPESLTLSARLLAEKLKMRGTPHFRTSGSKL